MPLPVTSLQPSIHVTGTITTSAMDTGNAAAGSPESSPQLMSPAWMRPMQEMNHCRHGPGRFRECNRPMQEMNHCRHGPGRFRKCARPMQEMNHCRHGPACFRKCTKPKLETCVAGIGRPIAGNGLRPVLVMVQATHFRKWHVPFPAIYHFQNGADHVHVSPAGQSGAWSPGIGRPVSCGRHRERESPMGWTLRASGPR